MRIGFIILLIQIFVFCFSYTAYLVNLPSVLFSKASALSMFKKLYVNGIHRNRKRFSALGEGSREGTGWVFDFSATLVLGSILPWGFPVFASWEVVAGLIPSMFYRVNILQLDATVFRKSLKFKQSVMKSFAYFPLLTLRAAIRPLTLTVRILANALVGAILCHTLAKSFSFKLIHRMHQIRLSAIVLLRVILIWEMTVILVQSSLFLGLSKIYYHPTPVLFKRR